MIRVCDVWKAEKPRINSNALLSLFSVSDSTFFFKKKNFQTVYFIGAVENDYCIGSYAQGSPWDILNYLLGELHIKTTS